MEAFGTLPLNGAGQGGGLVCPSLQQHGRRALQPRRGFPRGCQHRSQKPTTPPSNVTLTVVQPDMSPWHEPTLETERILMVDFTCTQAQAEAPPSHRGEATVEAAVPKSPLLTADGLDKMYHQLAEIHIIATMQLAECACWHRIDLSPHSARAGTSRQRTDAVPPAMKLAPSPPADFSSQALL
jgi:hypothetical protein